MKTLSLIHTKVVHLNKEQWKWGMSEMTQGILSTTAWKIPAIWEWLLVLLAIASSSVECFRKWM